MRTKIMLLILLFLSSETRSEDKKRVLAIYNFTNYDKVRLEEKVRGVKDAVRDLKSIYRDLEFDIVFYKTKNDSTIPKKVRNHLKKGSTILILGSDSSKLFESLKKEYPSYIPIISQAGTASLLDNSGLNVFTTSSTSIEKSNQINWLIETYKYKGALFVIDSIKNSAYGTEVKDIFIKDHPFKGATVDARELKTINCKDKLVIFRNKDDIIKNNSLSCDIYLLQGSREALFSSNRIFSSSSRIPGASRIHESSDYTSAYNSMKERVLVALKSISLSFSPVLIRRDIIDALKDTNKENPYVGEYSIAFKQIGDGSAYYNQYIELGMYNKYITRIDKKHLLSKIQMPLGFDPKKQSKKDPIPVVFVDFNIKKIEATGIKPDLINITSYLRLYSTSKEIDFSDIIIPTAITDSIVYSLSNKRTYEKKDIKHYSTMYKLSFDTKVDSDMFYFPFDTQEMNVLMEPKNFNDKKFFIQPVSMSDSDIVINDPNWDISSIEGVSLSQNIKVRPTPNITEDRAEIISVPLVGFKVELKRKNEWATVLKFAGPIAAILFLVLMSFFFLNRQQLSEKITIVVSGLLAIISIYFIFSILINIESFVVFDLLFILSVLFCVFVLVFEMYYANKGERENRAVADSERNTLLN